MVDGRCYLLKEHHKSPPVGKYYDWFNRYVDVKWAIANRWILSRDEASVFYTTIKNEIDHNKGVVYQYQWSS